MRSRQVFFIFTIILFFFSACGGGGGFRFSALRQPVDIQVSNLDLTFDNRTTRFVYVADSFSESIVVIDQDQERIVDTDGGDDFDENPISVGGQLTALAVQDRTLAPRIFVVDAQARKLFAFDAVPPSDTTQNVLAHVPVDLGGTPEGRAGRALFRNSGRLSSPTLPKITVNAAIAQNENWELNFDNNTTGYRVKGSISGEQTNRAQENVAYTSDDGSISFTITSGGERTTSGDKFYFGTVVTQPLSLTGRPVDLQIDATNLYILTSDPARVEILNLETLTITSQVALVDGSGMDVVPTGSVLANGHIYITNQTTANLLDFDVNALTASVIATGVQARAVGENNQILYLFPFSTREVARWDLSSNTLLSSIRLSDYGFSFGSFVLDNTSFGLVPTSAGGIDVLDLDQGNRVDTRDTGDPESTSLLERFFDVDPVSSPDLISVTTVDNVTRTERWQLVFEGIIPETNGLTATISGIQLTALSGMFQTLGIQSGDLVVLDPNGTAEEVLVDQVSSETVLALSTAPQTQGSTTMEIRPSQSYVVTGSQSGVQKNRVTEGTSYTSDEGAISLTIRASRSQPTTRGDFFTFLTSEGIDPVIALDKRLGQAAAVFTRPNQTDPTAYVVQEGSGAISVLDLRNLRERRTIR